MPGRPEDFEEAWARIVEDLTSDAAVEHPPATPPTGAPSEVRADGTGAAGPAPVDPGDRDHDPDPVAATDHGPADTGPVENPAASGSTDTLGSIPASLHRLFEPLNEPSPAELSGPGARDPGAFVDNWSDEGHYTPPPPPELPEGTPVKRLAWAGLLGGPATLAAMTLTGWDPPSIVGIGAGLATLAGFITLVWHLPESREDGWDDGARV